MNKDKIEGIVNEILLICSQYLKDDTDIAYGKISKLIIDALTAARNEGFIAGLDSNYR